MPCLLNGRPGLFVKHMQMYWKLNIWTPYFHILAYTLDHVDTIVHELLVCLFENVTRFIVF